MNPYLKQYQKNQIETATPERILIMLYDGAIQYLNIARNEMMVEGRKDIQKIHNNIVSAEKIITEFKCTLNMEIGGDVANNLYELYSYFYRRLVEANIKKDVAPIDEVLWHLKELKSTWLQAIDIAQKERVNKEVQVGEDEYISDSSDDDFEDVEEDQYEKAYRD